jgi:hypothetical protein
MIAKDTIELRRRRRDWQQLKPVVVAPRTCELVIGEEHLAVNPVSCRFEQRLRDGSDEFVFELRREQLPGFDIVQLIVFRVYELDSVRIIAGIDDLP